MKAQVSTFLSRLASFFRRRRMEASMTEEMQAHVDVLTEAGLAAGMAPAEARAAALRRFGGVAQIEERCRDQRGFLWLEQIIKDAGFAARSLGRARGFTLTVVAMLVLGIGVATFVFDATAWILVFAQPYPHPEQLYLLGFKDKHSPSNPYQCAVQFQAYREQTNVFSEYAAVTHAPANAVVEGEPVVVNLTGVSVDCYRTLGIKPVLGRGFLAEEFHPGANNVVIITDLFWRKNFHADPDVLGRHLVVDQQPCTVVGVLAAGQSFPPTFEGDVYQPGNFSVDPNNPISPGVFIIGRLKPGVSPEQARAALSTVKLPALPLWAAGFFADWLPILIRPTDVARPETFWVMAIAAALLYAIACLNAMNLMLVRLMGRRQELSIRFALGGTRWQIARLLAIESAGLALVAGLAVLLAARFLFGPLFALILNAESERYVSYWDARTLTCIAALSLLACLAVVAAPIVRLWKTEINPGLKDGSAAAGSSRAVGRVRTSLVIFQAAFAFVLLAGAGLMVQSFARLHRTDLGFDPVGRVKTTISFPNGYDLKPEARLQFFERLKIRLAALPGVREVSFGQDSLLVGGFYGTAQLLMPDGTYQAVAGNFVSADFLKVSGLVLKKGRWLSGKRGEYEAVINETFAKARFGDEDPIGKSFKLHVSGDFVTPVVGVVRDVKETVRSTPGMCFYVPDWVYPPNVSTLVLRLDRDPGKEFAGLVRHAIYQFDPRLIATKVISINEIVSNEMWAERQAFTILKGLSVVALALAVVGLFSVIACTVDSRTKEFGVRMALGARPADLHRLVMRHGLMTAGVGVAVGIAGALALTRFMQSLLFETTSYDPLVYATVAVVLLAAAVLACWIPARRAARVDIARLLRTE
jgi:putative ABC transport system permease protein